MIKGTFARILRVAGTALLIVLTVAGWGRAQSVDNAYSLDYPQAVQLDYRYRTERVIESSQKSRTIWDYFSFFAWKSKKNKAIMPPAAESKILKARVKELERQLVVNARESIADEYVLTVNSFVNLNNLYKTSSLGRYISEQLIGDLQMSGIEVIDVRKAAGIMIHEKAGEYGLSRDMRELSYIHTAQAMIVGTYTYADGQIFLNARLLRNNDGMVLSNASLAFDLDPLTRRLLADEAMPPRKSGLVQIESFDARN